MPEPSSSRSQLESTLSSTVDRFGPSLFFDPARLRGILLPAAGDARRDADLLVDALSDEVPQRLLGAHDDAALAALLPQLVDRLAKARSLDRASAAWVVRTWAHALALSSAGIERDAASAPSGTASAWAPSVDRTTAAAMTRPNARPPVPVPAAAPVARTDTSEPAPRVGSQPPDATEAARSGLRAAPVPPATVPSQPPRSFDAAEALSDFEPLTDAQAHPDETAVAPTPELVPGAMPGEATATMAASADAAAPASRFDEPVPGARPRAQRRSLVAAVTIVVVLLAGLGAWWWGTGVRPSSTPSAGPTVGERTAPPPAPVADVVKRAEVAPAVPPVPESASVAEPQSAPASTPDAATASPPPPKKAVPSAAPKVAPSQAAKSGACARGACGVVVSVREVETRKGGVAYATTIRMDDRSIRSVLQSTRLAVGTRMRAADGRYVPM